MPNKLRSGSDLLKLIENPNKRIREERLAILHDQIEEFFNNHLDELGHLVDGSKFNLTLTI